jgi:hypothetical protein
MQSQLLTLGGDRGDVSVRFQPCVNDGPLLIEVEALLGYAEALAKRARRSIASDAIAARDGATAPLSLQNEPNALPPIMTQAP